MARKYLLELHQQLEKGAPLSVVTPFSDWGTLELDEDRLRKDPDSIRAIFFAGGSDISPELYDEPAGSRLGEVDRRRDESERELFRIARSAGIPMIGICRGAQFLCIMAGGKVCQHVEGHRIPRDQTHRIEAIDVDGSVIQLECSSEHHQMQLPSSDAKVLAWADPRLANGQFFDGHDRQITAAREFEAVYYPNINAIGFQWHPEWMPLEHSCVDYTRRIATARLRL